MYCQAQNCRFPWSHVTAGHKCGNCQKYGHGAVECGKPKKIAKLQEFSKDEMPTEAQCQLYGCTYPKTHRTDGHTLPYLIWNVKETPSGLWSELTPFVEPFLEAAHSEKEPVYAQFATGMGCSWFVRSTPTSKRVEAFFLHSDAQGQYGAQYNHLPELDTFLMGYRKIEVPLK